MIQTANQLNSIHFPGDSRSFRPGEASSSSRVRENPNSGQLNREGIEKWPIRRGGVVVYQVQDGGALAARGDGAAEVPAIVLAAAGAAGFACIDNNLAERQLRAQAIGRRN